MEFKILFPSGYQVADVLQDNIDINVVTSDDKVYFATLFTSSNIIALMEKDNISYFWATDMIVVADLQRSTIEDVVKAIIRNGYLADAMTEIGMVSKIYRKYKRFDQIPDSCLKIVND